MTKISEKLLKIGKIKILGLLRYLIVLPHLSDLLDMNNIQTNYGMDLQEY